MAETAKQKNNEDFGWCCLWMLGRNSWSHEAQVSHLGTLFFEWAKIFETKLPKNTTFVIISLNFRNNQWNSRKNLFTVRMIGLHTWSSKLGVKIEKNGHLYFLSLKINFCDLQLKLPFQLFIDTWKTRSSVEE